MSKEKKFYLYPIIASMAIIPFIVYMYTYSSGYSEYSWFASDDTTADFFLYYKSVAITVVAAIMACVIIFQLIKQKKQIRFSKIFVPLFVYGGLTLLSAIFSKYPQLAFHGAYEQFESCWVLLGYVVIAYYAFLIADTPDKLQFILKGWFVSIGIMSLLGFTQVVGCDFFTTTLGKKLITSGDFWQYLSFTFEKGRVYLSLYNPNYVGSYVALAFPVLIVLTLLQKDKKQRIFYLLLIIGCSLSLLGSQSRTGILAIGVSLLLLAFLLRRELKRYWKLLIGFLALAIVIILGFNQLNNNVLFNRLTTMFTNSKVEYAITAIDTENDHVTIHYKDSSLSFYGFSVADGNILPILRDENGNPVEVTFDFNTESHVVNDTRFPGVTLTIKEYGYCILADGREWRFTNLTDGTFYFINGSGKTVKLNDTNSMPYIHPIFDIIGSFGGRDVIWSNSFPILKDTLLLGSGPDTFTLMYPQEFYLYKTYQMTEASVDVKPHNLYLQIGIHSGVVALIAFLIFYGMYFIQSICIYSRETFETFHSQAGVGIFIGTLAYMITGIANDSSVTVAPIFWALMGLGLSVNYMLLVPQKTVPVSEGNTKNTKKKHKK